MKKHLLPGKEKKKKKNDDAFVWLGKAYDVMIPD